MRNTIGSPVTKGDFYPRIKEMKQIVRGLEDGNHLYLSAPRRVGKTSIMQQLEVESPQGFVAVYGIYQSCTTSEEFFKRLCKDLLESGLYSKLDKAARAVFQKAAELVGVVKAVEAYGIKLELASTEGLDWSEKFQNVLRSLKLGNQKLVIMIDEFPEVVEQILKLEGEGPARTFLHRHREIRQDPAYRDRVQFIYTGSIGILNTVSKTGDTKVVNDLYPIQVGPLSPEEAAEMAEKILKHYSYRIRKNELKYLIAKLDWLIPFHVKLLLEQIRNQARNEGEYIEEEHIDEAFHAICNQDDVMEFQHYFGRISTAFSGNKKAFAHQVLSLLAKHSYLMRARLFDLATELDCEETCDDTLRALEIDGYIHLSEGTYQFRSIILKSWWSRHESRKLS
jgi:uncharacterized protein